LSLGLIDFDTGSSTAPRARVGPNIRGVLASQAQQRLTPFDVPENAELTCTIADVLVPLPSAAWWKSGLLSAGATALGAHDYLTWLNAFIIERQRVASNPIATAQRLIGATSNLPGAWPESFASALVSATASIVPDIGSVTAAAGARPDVNWLDWLTLVSGGSESKKNEFAAALDYALHDVAETLSPEELVLANRAVLNAKIVFSAWTLSVAPTIWISDEGILAVQWEAESNGVLLVFTGDGTFTATIRDGLGRRYTTGAEEFEVSAGFSASLLEAIRELC
jgi:hypothetical protein